MIKLNPSNRRGFFYEIRKTDNNNINEEDNRILTIRKCEYPFLKGNDEYDFDLD